MKQSLLYALFAVLLLVSCKKSDTNEDSEAKQQDRIRRFVSANYQTYDSIGGVYRARLNQQPVSTTESIAFGDKAEIRYSIHLFSSKIDSLITTNIESEALKYGFDRSVMDFDPLVVQYGETALFEGFNIGLEALRVKDSVYLFVPSNLAYGKKINGVVPKNSSLAVFVTVISIEKN